MSLGCPRANAAAEPAEALCGRKLQEGGKLFESGRRQHALYAVRGGHLKVIAPVEGDGEHIVSFLMSGDVAGLDGLDGGRHATTAVALDDCEVCEIPLWRARELYASGDDAGIRLRRQVTRQLSWAQSQVAALTHRSAPQRLAAFLVELAERAAERGAGNVVALPMRRSDIADHLGLTIETVSRFFTEFRERGWIELRGREVRLLDVAALRECPRLPAPGAGRTTRGADAD